MSDRNHVWRLRRFQGLVLTLSVSLMHLWIVQQRRWRFLPVRNATQEFSIAHKQRVNCLDHLTRNTSNDASFAGIGLCALIKGTPGFNQALVQPRPFIVSQADYLQNGEEHNLLHRPGSPTGQVGGIQRAPRLSHHRRPAKVRFECRGRREVVDRTNSRDNRRSGDRPEAGKRQQDLPLARLINNRDDLAFQLVNMLAQEPKLFDQLALFQNQAPKANEVFDSDALSGQALQFQQFEVRERTRAASDLLQHGETGGRQRLWSRKLLTQSQRDQGIGVFDHANQLREQFVAEGRKLVFALGTLADQFVAVADQPFQLRCGLSWWHQASTELH